MVDDYFLDYKIIALVGASFFIIFDKYGGYSFRIKFIFLFCWYMEIGYASKYLEMSKIKFNTYKYFF